MRVKIFCETDAKRLEKMLNEWFEKNEKINIKEINQNVDFPRWRP